MRTDLFDFDLPPERIALRPASPRDAARLLVVRPGDAPETRRPRRARSAGPAASRRCAGGQRHQGHPGAAVRAGGSAAASEPAIEATLHKRLDGSRWRAFVRPAKKLQPGDMVRFGDEGRVCFLGQLDADGRAQGRRRRGDAVAFAFHGAGARSGDCRARRHAAAALYRRASARPTSRTAPTTRPCSRDEEGSVAAPTAGAAFHAGPGRAAAGARRRAASR